MLLPPFLGVIVAVATVVVAVTVGKSSKWWFPIEKEESEESEGKKGEEGRIKEEKKSKKEPEEERGRTSEIRRPAERIKGGNLDRRKEEKGGTSPRRRLKKQDNKRKKRWWCRWYLQLFWLSSPTCLSEIPKIVVRVIDHKATGSNNTHLTFMASDGKMKVKAMPPH